MEFPSQQPKNNDISHKRTSRRTIFNINQGQIDTNKMNLRSKKSTSQKGQFKTGKIIYEKPKYLNQMGTPERLEKIKVKKEHKSKYHTDSYKQDLRFQQQSQKRYDFLYNNRGHDISAIPFTPVMTGEFTEDTENIDPNGESYETYGSEDTEVVKQEAITRQDGLPEEEEASTREVISRMNLEPEKIAQTENTPRRVTRSSVAKIKLEANATANDQSELEVGTECLTESNMVESSNLGGTEKLTWTPASTRLTDYENFHGHTEESKLKQEAIDNEIVSRDIEQEIQNYKDRLQGVAGAAVYLRRKIPNIETMLTQKDMYTLNDVYGTWDMMMSDMEKLIERDQNQ